jgi:prevent-host-death family protein
MQKTWQLQEAKAKFSEVVERAMTEGAQVITRRGRKAVVVLPFAEYQRLTRPRQSLAQFLLRSPLAGAELATEREAEGPREIGLEA